MRLTLFDLDGFLPPQLPALRVIESIGTRKRIAGADLFGEFSSGDHANLRKRREVRVDHPERFSEAQRLARNERVNIELLATNEQASPAC